MFTTRCGRWAAAFKAGDDLMKTLTPTGRDEPSADPASGDVTTILRSASARMDPPAPLIFVSRLAPDDLDSPPHGSCRIDQCFFVTEGHPQVNDAASKHARVSSSSYSIDVTPRTLDGSRDALSRATVVPNTVKDGAA
jgi:hypothetical protein